MGVYIEGMEMPKDGTMIFAIRQDGMVEDVMGCFVGKAVPVPPHGKCIDVDALIKELALDDEDGNSGATLLMAIFLEVLKAAPTIIEAEEGE